MQDPHRDKLPVGTASVMMLGSASTITPMTTPGDAQVAQGADMESDPSGVDQVLSWDESEPKGQSEALAAQVLSSMSSVNTIVPGAAAQDEPMELPKRSEARRSATKSRSPPSKPMQRRGSKSHVPSACINCKKAHLACDLSRPCKRCTALGKEATCHDVQHKKRGRPKLKDTSPRGKESKPASVYTSAMTTSAAISAAAVASQTVPTTSVRKVPISHSSSALPSASMNVPGIHYQLYQSSSARPYSSLPGSKAQAFGHVDEQQPSPPKRSLLERIPLIRTAQKQRQQQLHAGLLSSSPPRPRDTSTYGLGAMQHMDASSVPPSLRPIEPILTPASSTPSPQGALMALRAGASLSMSNAATPRRELILTLIMTANDLTIARASDESATLLQVGPQQLQGKSMLDIIHVSDRERLLRLRERVLLRAGISPAHFEQEVLQTFPQNASYLAAMDPRELSRGAIGWPLPVFNASTGESEPFTDRTQEFTDTLHVQVYPFMERERLFHIRMRVGGGGYRVDVSRQQHMGVAGCLVVEVKEFGIGMEAEAKSFVSSSASSSTTSVTRHTLPKPEPWQKLPSQP